MIIYMDSYDLDSGFGLSGWFVELVQSILDSAQGTINAKRAN